MVNLENFDAAFDVGVNNVKNMVQSGPKTDIVNLCKKNADKNNKYPATLGIASFVPILDRNMEAIHAINDVLELTVPVPNESYDPNDKNSKPAYWTTFTYVPESNYKVPLTDEEKKANAALQQAMYDYNDSYGKYELKGKPIFFMKAILIRIKSDSAGPIYTDYTEPVVLRHTSSGFPSSYSSTVKDFDDTKGSKEWRRAVFLPDGDIRNIITCTTRARPNGAIGYDVSCSIVENVTTGKACTREKLKEYMDYDIASIGIDTTHFDLHQVKFFTDKIYEALEYMDSQSGAYDEPIDGNTLANQSVEQPTPTPQPQQAPAQTAPVVPQVETVAQPKAPVNPQPQTMAQQNVVPQQTMAYNQPTVNAQTTPVNPAPSFDTMNAVPPTPPTSGVEF